MLTKKKISISCVSHAASFAQVCSGFSVPILHHLRTEGPPTTSCQRAPAVATWSGLPQIKPKKGSPCSTVGTSCHMNKFKVSKITDFRVSSQPNQVQHCTSGVLMSQGKQTGCLLKTALSWSNAEITPFFKVIIIFLLRNNFGCVFIPSEELPGIPEHLYMGQSHVCHQLTSQDGSMSKRSFQFW